MKEEVEAEMGRYRGIQEGTYSCLGRVFEWCVNFVCSIDRGASAGCSKTAIRAASERKRDGQEGINKIEKIVLLLCIVTKS